MPIVCLGLNHRTAPVNVREQFALAEAKLPELWWHRCAREPARRRR